MTYLSQLLGKTVYYDNIPFGKIIDMAIFTNSSHAPVSKIEIMRGKKKLTISPSALSFENNKFTLKTQHIPLLPYDHKDFYLAEDLLDKQVIDIDGKRLVRVNDIILEINGEIKVIGIDIGFHGVMRRLGLSFFNHPSKIIPWEYIEAFDYQTGDIKIKLTQHSLNTLHPSELATILEDVGTKERIGLVAALDAKKAARAIEETDNQTQISILEEIPAAGFQEVLKKMRSSELADIFNYLNPLKTQEIQKALGIEKVKRVKKLLGFSHDVAGGIMRSSFFRVDAYITVKEMVKLLSEDTNPPETIVVTNGNEKLVGTVYTKNLLGTDPLAIMKDIVKERKFVYSTVHISHIFRLFTEYNLRSIPVVDKEKKPIGIIVIDDLLKVMEEKDE